MDDGQTDHTEGKRGDFWRKAPRTTLGGIDERAEPSLQRDEEEKRKARSVWATNFFIRLGRHSNERKS